MSIVHKPIYTRCSINRVDNLETLNFFNKLFFFLIFQGFYSTTGLDASHFMNGNYPKTFFYGIFKIRFYLTLKNEGVGCFFIIVELKHP